MRILLTVFLYLTAAPAAEWPQWRGPHFNGFSEEKGLPASWSKTKNVAWAAKLPGPGASTPAVRRGRVFLTAIEEESRRLWAMCLDMETGRVLWKRPAGKGFLIRRGNTAASPSPIVDGERVYFLFGTGEFLAFDLDGRPVWRRNLTRDHGEFVLKWKYAASPLLFGGKLYVAVLHSWRKARRSPGQPPPASYLLCIDPATGKDIWKHVRRTDAEGEACEAYTTPYPFVSAQGPQIILSGGDYATAHDPATGAEIWRSNTYNPRKQKWFRTVASPVSCGDILLISAARGSSMFALRAGRRGRLTAADRAWTARRNAPDVPTPLAMGGRFYVLCGKRKVMTCLDPETGAVVWSAKLGVRLPLEASPTGADGKIYCISLGGEVVVLQAGDAFRVLSRVFMGEASCRSSIAVAEGRLFVRTAEHLYCIRQVPAK